MNTISRQQAKRMIETQEDLQVVEALGLETFEEFHLPGAHSVPVDDAFETRIEAVAPQKSAPVLVYCMDAECPASSKAAQKLEALGYTEVYDYEAGKVDWKEAGLPLEHGRGDQTT